MSEADLDRFLKEQEEDYPKALEEIKSGKKKSCWMWYIFPQIQGLGFSEMNKKYSLKDIEEAKAYLENETLKSRLIEITQALLDLEDADIHEVMSIDDCKLKSSMTLFKIVEEQYNIDCGKVFQKTLDKYFNGEDDQRTITILEKQKFEKLMSVKKKNIEEKNENGINNNDEDKINVNTIVIENNNENIKEENNDNINNNIQHDSITTQNEEKEEEEQDENNKEIKETEKIEEPKKNNNILKIMNEKINEIKIEKDDDENKEKDIIKEEEKEEEDSEDKKEKEGGITIIEENKILSQEAEINTNSNSCRINENSQPLCKKSSIHFSLPSRSQLKSMDNNNNKKNDDLEMIITDKKIENKTTIVLYPFEDENKKKCCPDCFIF